MANTDVRTQIADLMASYDRYIKGKQTGQGIANNRDRKEQADAKPKKATSSQVT